jgi:hypothetical protein
LKVEREFQTVSAGCNSKKSGCASLLFNRIVRVITKSQGVHMHPLMTM